MKIDNIFKGKAKLYMTLEQSVFSLATRTQPSPCETEFSWLLDSLQFVTAKTGALCSEAQRVKYIVINIINKVYSVLFPVKQVSGKTK